MDKIKVCNSCLMPNSRPRVSFNKDGICNACIYVSNKKNINWIDREKEFLDICNQNRSKDGNYDCIVPWSGGKDSSSIAHKLKFKYKMNPLLVTFSPLIPSKIGYINRQKLIKCGLDNYFFSPNGDVSSYLANRFFVERGNPKVAWDAGVNSLPLHVATEKNIKLVFFAEHGESEYGGNVLTKDSDKIRDLDEVLENQIGDIPENWVDDKISLNDLNMYRYPDAEKVLKKDIKAYYFSYFFKWDVFENFEYCKKNFNFQTSKKRITGTFQNYDSMDDHIDHLYYYMQYIKFGFGRCLRDVSRMVQNNHMKRNEAIDYVNKYDGEFPEDNLDEVLNFLNINLIKFNEIVEMHRNNEIWTKKKNELIKSFELL
ncbi:N-acetyl sugar amidotransferase [Candidatus Pelagibacter bacterium nBUS_25]|uniref:N-acetyl sugar amidotransferase n=1 Tax=Candidatus Pelagibacter bacterium nBUS_25 TaxID=3374187 RepID=UPI003EC12919